MDKEIIRIFNEANESELELEYVRGGICIGNTTCNTEEFSCNKFTCTQLLMPPPDK